jgi:hypothetical protein
LLKVQFVQTPFPFFIGRQHDRNAVQVAGGRTARDRIGTNTLDQIWSDRIGLVIAYSAVLVQ